MENGRHQWLEQHLTPDGTPPEAIQLDLSSPSLNNFPLQTYEDSKPCSSPSFEVLTNDMLFIVLFQCTLFYKVH